MPIYYKGAGSGTYWARNNAGLRTGFTAHDPGINHSTGRMVAHIANGPMYSPYISITASYAIAEMYARSGRDPNNPGIVYEIEFNDPLPANLQMYDPLYEITNSYASVPNRAAYHHNGNGQLLLGLVDPSNFANVLSTPVATPPTTTNVMPHLPNVTPELMAMVNSIRDSELLVLGTIPRSNIGIQHVIN